MLTVILRSLLLTKSHARNLLQVALCSYITIRRPSCERFIQIIRQAAFASIIGADLILESGGIIDAVMKIGDLNMFKYLMKYDGALIRMRSSYDNCIRRILLLCVRNKGIAFYRSILHIQVYDSRYDRFSL